MSWFSFYFRHAIHIFRIVIIFVLYFLSIDVWLIYVYISQFTKLGFNTRQARYTKRELSILAYKKSDLLNLRQFFHHVSPKNPFYKDYLLCHILKGVYWSNILLIVHFVREVGKLKKEKSSHNEKIFLKLILYVERERHFFYIKKTTPQQQLYIS